MHTHIKIMGAVKFLLGSQHSKLIRSRMLNEPLWELTRVCSMTRFNQLHGHDSLRYIQYQLKMNFHSTMLNSSTSFIKDLIQLSQIWKTLKLWLIFIGSGFVSKIKYVKSFWYLILDAGSENFRTAITNKDTLKKIY